MSRHHLPAVPAFRFALIFAAVFAVAAFLILGMVRH